MWPPFYSFFGKKKRPKTGGMARFNLNFSGRLPLFDCFSSTHTLEDWTKYPKFSDLQKRHVLDCIDFNISVQKSLKQMHGKMIDNWSGRWQWPKIDQQIHKFYLTIKELLLMEEIRLTSWGWKFIPLFTGWYTSQGGAGFLPSSVWLDQGRLVSNDCVNYPSHKKLTFSIWKKWRKIGRQSFELCLFGFGLLARGTCCCYLWRVEVFTLPETNVAPENGWLEY